ncbi:hypothetical protein CCACVL1_04771 [Corchorus capsularis]|uniref:Uncharacterized protein n=1 Tax=Corchorus capsularis TaxID=210143 RepID=A0A1R3JPN1_COCAP|nr:hypothetical protein CCACVL1_04771 [Corchorus capsularis]
MSVVDGEFRFKKDLCCDRGEEIKVGPQDIVDIFGLPGSGVQLRREASTIGRGGSGLNIDTSYFSSFTDDLIFNGRIDWATHVYTTLINGIDGFLGPKQREYVSGCVVILQVIYADVVSGDRRRRNEQRPRIELFNKWGDEEMNNLLRNISDYANPKMVR